MVSKISGMMNRCETNLFSEKLLFPQESFFISKPSHPDWPIVTQKNVYLVVVLIGSRPGCEVGQAVNIVFSGVIS